MSLVAYGGGRVKSPNPTDKPVTASKAFLLPLARVENMT
jgi:hypothetical protein